MSTILNTNGSHLEIPQWDKTLQGQVHVITADWNSDITYALRDGAIDVLKKAGIEEKNIICHSVPGTVELVNAAAFILNETHPLAVIVIGCVVRGDTPHFDYVCQIAAQGVARLNSEGKAPVIFGVLTVDTLRQAQERAGGVLGNKGAEAAAAAITMVNLQSSILSE